MIELAEEVLSSTLRPIVWPSSPLHPLRRRRAHAGTAARASARASAVVVRGPGAVAAVAVAPPQHDVGLLPKDVIGLGAALDEVVQARPELGHQRHRRGSVDVQRRGG
jgi:hypothetical protein